METPHEDVLRMLDTIEYNIDQLEAQICEVCGEPTPASDKVRALNNEYSRNMHADLNPEVINKVYTFFHELHDILQSQPELQKMLIQIRSMFKECVES